MTEEEIFRMTEKLRSYNFGDNIIDAFTLVLEDTKPNFRFALRDDIKDDKRFLPTRSEPKASGYDVKAAFTNKMPLIIKPFEYFKIPLGFRAFCPAGWWLELRPRSSTFSKKNIQSLYGVIDEGFEGQMLFAGQYIPTLNIYRDIDKVDTYFPELTINYGDAIGQLIPIRRQEMNIGEMSNEQYDQACKERNGIRGIGGFGSTDG